MFELAESIPKDIVHVYVLWVAGIGHAVIANEDDVYDLGEVSCGQ